MTYVTSTPVTLATEWEMSEARRNLRRRERIARLCLGRCGTGASPEAIVAAALEGWPTMTPIEATKIAGVADTLRSEVRAATRHVPVNQYLEETTMGEMQDKIRAATRELLLTYPDMDRTEMHSEVMQRTDAILTLGSWQTMYLYPVRKMLQAGVDTRPYVPPPAVDIPETEVKLKVPPPPAASEDAATILTRNGEWYRVGRGGDTLEAFGHDGTWEISIHVRKLDTADVMKIARLVQPMILDFGP